MNITLPTTKELENELNRIKYKDKYKRLFKSTIYALLIVIAISVIIATYLFPVLQIYGNSMEPTLSNGEIVVSIKSDNFNNGDVIAFYYNNKILIKRIIALPNRWVNIDEYGNVYVNNELVDEPYIKNKSLGNSNIEYPYQVKEGTYFVLGDERELSIDSRNTTIGTISKKQILGKVIFRVWPLNNINLIK